jgi:hypothetical protein
MRLLAAGLLVVVAGCTRAEAQPQRGLTEPTSANAVAAVRAYRALIEAWNREDAVYFGMFRDTLDCFYGDGGTPRAQVERARHGFGGRMTSVTIAVLREGADWVELADYGLVSDGYAEPYAKAVRLTLTDGRFRVAAEVGSRGRTCGASPFRGVRHPDPWARCTAAYSRCRRPCAAQERSQGQPSNGTEMCHSECDDRLRCCLGIPLEFNVIECEGG